MNKQLTYSVVFNNVQDEWMATCNQFKTASFFDVDVLTALDECINASECDIYRKKENK